MIKAVRMTEPKPTYCLPQVDARPSRKMCEKGAAPLLPALAVEPFFDASNMDRLKGVDSIVVSDDNEHPFAHGDELPVRHVELASVRHVNYERLEPAGDHISDPLDVHNGLLKLRWRSRARRRALATAFLFMTSRKQISDEGPLAPFRVPLNQMHLSLPHQK
jgi:hypothetical protein